MSLFSGLMTWQPDVQQYGQDATTWRLAAASLFLPIGAILWIVSPGLAHWSFAAEPVETSSLTRHDLYAFGSLLVGLFLLVDAIPQVTYWVVLWRSAADTGFWNAARDFQTDHGVVYWVHARAQVGLVLTQLVLGVACVLGPERLGRGARRVRSELSDHLADEPPAKGAADGQHGA
jgi:hypothetical protein